MQNFYEIGKAAKLSGLSIAMVDYLCRTKIVVPATGKRGRGRKRRYTFAEVVVLRSISKLLNAGVDVCKLGNAIKALRKYHPEITPNTLPSAFLVTNGKDVFFSPKEGVVECLSSGQFAFAFVIEIAAVRNEVVEHEAYAA